MRRVRAQNRCIGPHLSLLRSQSFDRPTGAQLEAMKSLVAEAMADGAFGLSSLVMMPPGSLATTDDFVELCRVVRQYGGIYATHIRNEGLGVFDSIREAIAIGDEEITPENFGTIDGIERLVASRIAARAA